MPTREHTHPLRPRGAMASTALPVLAGLAVAALGAAARGADTPPANPAPRHYPHIRVGGPFPGYTITQLGPLELQLLHNSFDIVFERPDLCAAMHAAAPTTPIMTYTNLSNIYLNLLMDWSNYADSNGFSREQAFYHVTVASSYTGGDGGSTVPVNDFQSWNRFWTGAPGSLVEQWNPPFALAASAGSAWYVSYPEKFCEINLTLTSTPAGGWSEVIEFPTAVDATGAPIAWSTLPLLSDGTAGAFRDGQITFDSPAAWVPCALPGTAYRFYWLRFRTTASGTAPVVATILGRDYVGAAGTAAGTVPVFDYAADLNGDGFLDSSEYPHHAAGKTARFAYEGRAISTYGPWRFGTNPSNARFRQWALGYEQRYLAQAAPAQCLMMDNSGSTLSGSVVGSANLMEPSATYLADYSSLLGAVAAEIMPGWIMPNVAGDAASDIPTIASSTHALWYESFERPLQDYAASFQDHAALVKAVLAADPSNLLVLDSNEVGGAKTDPRTQIATLAEYDQFQDPEHTMLEFYGHDTSVSWDQHWVPAAAYDVGQPDGPYVVLATGSDPENSAFIYTVYMRAYDNALALYKPLSHRGYPYSNGTLDDATATVHALPAGQTYYPLQADGTLGAPLPTASVTLRNGEGAILILGSSLAPAAPTILDQPQDQSVAAGGSATFSVVASGVPAPSFAWQQSTDGTSWSPVAGGSAFSMTLPAVAVAESGMLFRCQVSNTQGAVTSAAATLTVTPAIGASASTGTAGSGGPTTGVGSSGDGSHGCGFGGAFAALAIAIMLRARARGRTQCLER